MPYRSIYVSPEKFMRYKGIVIYHIYINDDMESMVRTYSYTTDPLRGSDNGGEDTFDVRELSTWKEPNHPPFLCGQDDNSENKKAWDEWNSGKGTEKAIKLVIREAIDKGEIPQNP